jgi:hypothetical protein
MSAIASTRKHDSIDLSMDSLWTGPSDIREWLFAELRHTRPVSWQRPIRSPLMELMGQEPPGYWAVVGLDDIITVVRDGRGDLRGHARGDLGGGVIHPGNG